MADDITNMMPLPVGNGNDPKTMDLDEVRLGNNILMYDTRGNMDFSSEEGILELLTCFYGMVPPGTRIPRGEEEEWKLDWTRPCPGAMDLILVVLPADLPDDKVSKFMAGINKIPSTFLILIICQIGDLEWSLL